VRLRNVALLLDHAGPVSRARRAAPPPPGRLRRLLRSKSHDPSEQRRGEAGGGARAMAAQLRRCPSDDALGDRSFIAAQPLNPIALEVVPPTRFPRRAG